MAYQTSPARRAQDVRRYPVTTMQVMGSRADVNNAILMLQQRGTYIDVPQISFHPTGSCRATLRYYNTNIRPVPSSPATPAQGYPRHPSYQPRQWPVWAKPAIAAGSVAGVLGLVYLVGALSGVTTLGMLSIIAGVAILMARARLGRKSTGGAGVTCGGQHCAGCTGCR